MKLHLPLFLRKSVIACLAAVTGIATTASASLTTVVTMDELLGSSSLTLGTGVADVSSGEDVVYSFSGNGIIGITNQEVADAFSSGSGYVTVAAWVNPSASGQQGIFAYGDTLKFDMNGSSLRTTSWGEKDANAGELTLSSGNWYMVAVTIDLSKTGDNTYMFLGAEGYTGLTQSNGYSLGNWSTPSAASPQFAIGSSKASTQNAGFNGLIGNLTVFSSDSAATVEELASIMGNGIPSCDLPDPVISGKGQAGINLGLYQNGYRITFDLDNADSFSVSNNFFADSNVTVVTNSDVQIGATGGDGTTGLVITNGNGGNHQIFTGSLSGNGLIKKTGAGTGTSISFTGDTSEYSGNIVLNSSENFTLTFGSVTVSGTEYAGVAGVSSAEKGIIGNGSVTISGSSGKNNKLVFNYAAGAAPVYITNTFSFGANANAKVELNGAADYILTRDLDILAADNRFVVNTTGSVKALNAFAHVEAGDTVSTTNTMLLNVGSFTKTGAGTLNVANELKFDKLSLQGGVLSMSDSLRIDSGRELALGTFGAVLDSDLSLADGKLSLDYSGSGAVTSLNNSALILQGGTSLQLSGLGSGDGRVYDLFTGISNLLGSDGSTLVLNPTNNAISNYFDTTQPGAGFWAGSTLQLSDNGTLQLVRHNEVVKAAASITSRQTNGADYQYYESIEFKDIKYSSSSNSSNVCGGAVYGGDDSNITLSNNGSVLFSGNSASYTGSTSSYTAINDVYGGAIYGGNNSKITLNDNRSVEFRGNSVVGDPSSYSYAYGSAIYAGNYSDITLNNNANVLFAENSSSSGVIYAGAYSNITLNNNGNVLFTGNLSAIYCADNNNVTLSNNGNVLFTRNSVSSGVIYGYQNFSLTLSKNGSVTFSENAGGAISLGSGMGSSELKMCDNGSITFSGNLAGDNYMYSSGAISVDSGNFAINNNDSVLFEKNVLKSDSGYHMRSIYMLHTYNKSSVVVLSLSSAEDKSIEFRDAVYIGNRIEVNLNRDYTDASGVTHKQKGDIVFTGKYTEAHLNEWLESNGVGRTATMEEIISW